MIKSFKWAVSGLKTVWKEEGNFRIECVMAVVAIVAAFIIGLPLVGTLFVVIACVMVLSGEIVNTAVEDICNKIEPDDDPVIGKIKDIMAGYVLITSLGAIIIGVTVFGYHLWGW